MCFASCRQLYLTTIRLKMIQLSVNMCCVKGQTYGKSIFGSIESWQEMSRN